MVAVGAQCILLLDDLVDIADAREEVGAPGGTVRRAAVRKRAPGPASLR